MFNFPILDLVILLSFTYFIGSLILSSINEAISGALRLRQNHLRSSIDKLFFDPQWRLFVKTKFFKNPFLETLMKKRGKFPAYIPASNFVSALIELIEGPWSVSALKQKSTKDILPPDILKVMQTIWAQAQNSNAVNKSEDFEKRLEEFYNNAMDRVTGWYKRKVRRVLLVLAIILSVALNIDTIKIANDALKDKEKLSKAVDNITANIAKIDSLRSVVISDTSLELSSSAINDKTKQIEVVYQQTSGYLLGYNGDFKKQWKENFWKKLLGILITAFALQLGSNYWFDLMNKAVNVRSVGKKPDEKTEQPSTKKS